MPQVKPTPPPAASVKQAKVGEQSGEQIHPNEVRLDAWTMYTFHPRVATSGLPVIRPVLWGTLSPKRRDNPEAIRDYMVNAFKALREHKVSFGDQLIRVYGDMAINSGYYTFAYNKDGESKSLPDRYSFVYAKRNGQWMIVDSPLICNARAPQVAESAFCRCAPASIGHGIVPGWLS
jgi:hypothetical protein